MRHRRTLSTATAAAAALAAGLATAAPAQASTQVAVWKMADSGSTMRDWTGHGHDGTLHHVEVRHPGINGGHGFGFRAHPAYVAVPAAGDLNPGTSTFSFSIHVRFSARPSSSVGDFDVLRKGLSSSDGGSYKAEVLADGRAFCNFRGSTAEVGVSGGPDLADGTWHTITCTRTATSVVLAVAGRSYTRTGRTGTISNSGSLYIGAKDGGGADQFTGNLDNASVTKG